MKNKAMAYCMLLLLIVSGCSSNEKKETKVTKETQTTKYTVKESTEQTTNKESETIDLSGTFYTESGDTGEIKSLDKNKWEISYCTSDGEVTGIFETKWKSSGQAQQSKTPMEKSDGYSGFEVVVEFVSDSDIKITMTDGNVAHEMVFTSQKPKEDEIYSVILRGDLSPFAGQFSNDNFNKKIVESGFTYGGYTPEDYYNNRTTVFPTITENGYWNGITSHGNYEVKASDLPKKVGGYYEVHVYGTNPGANNGELTFFLVPPEVKGPDGTLSDDKRVFQQSADGQVYPLEYQKENWWEAY